MRRASGQFCAPRINFDGSEGVGSRFHFFVPVHISGGTEGVGSRFHVLRFRTRFRRFRGCRLPFSCFALPNSFPVVPRASGHVFMFCVPVLAFGGTEGVGPRFHVLHPLNRFQRYRERLLLFSCFALSDVFLAVRRAYAPFFIFAFPDSFSAVPWASVPVFMFCSPELDFGGIYAVGSRFNFLCSRTLFRRCGGRHVPFSCFALPDSFSTVLRVSGPFFMFCVPVLFFGGTEGVGSRIHVLRAQTHFRGYRRRRVTFSSFALLDTFSAM
jgi:hypothetical protein